jgi:hypothetical protein
VKGFVTTISLAALATLVVPAWGQVREPLAASGNSKLPAKIRILKGQTLEEIAEKFFGDPSAAVEIRALNSIADGEQPDSGAEIRLPGQERDRVLTALRVATQALAQANADGASEFAPKDYKSAADSLDRAKKALSRAAYAECRRLADETWALARQARKASLAKRPKKNRFEVSVDRKGDTRVAVLSGDGVKVSAGKKSKTVKQGHAVRVEAGQAPSDSYPLLDPPTRLLPAKGSILVTAAIYFNWKPVAGATRYVILIAGDPHGQQAIRQMTTENTSLLFKSSLPDGQYYWFIRTVDPRGLVGRASPARKFILRASRGNGSNIKQPAHEDAGHGD